MNHNFCHLIQKWFLPILIKLRKSKGVFVKFNKRNNMHVVVYEGKNEKSIFEVFAGGIVI